MTKGPLAFRTISEAADILGVPQHVLRFWESKFTFIRPTKRAGGRRFYRPQDIALLDAVKTLLHERGYTIRGVQKLFKEQGQKAILSPDTIGAAPEPSDGVASMLAEGVAEVDLKVLDAELKAQFLEIADALDEAQRALGAAIGRHRLAD